MHFTGPFRVVETPHRVVRIEPALVTRFRRRADREAARLNRLRDPELPSYRWEVHARRGRRGWQVVAMQNVIQKVNE